MALKRNGITLAPGFNLVESLGELAQVSPACCMPRLYEGAFIGVEMHNTALRTLSDVWSYVPWLFPPLPLFARPLPPC